MVNKSAFKEGLRDCLPTVLGYLSVSFACGVLSRTAGMSVIEIALLSIFLYAGSGQFIVAAMFALRTPPMIIITTVFFVNLRHLLLSSSVATKFDHLKPAQSFLVGALLTDETFGNAIIKSSNVGTLNFTWMAGVNIAAYSSWFTGNLLGAIFGSFIPSPEVLGLDFAIVSMFIIILITQLATNNELKRDIIVIIVTVFSMLLFVYLNFSYLSIILASIVGASAGMVVEKCL